MKIQIDLSPITDLLVSIDTKLGAIISMNVQAAAPAPAKEPPTPPPATTAPSKEVTREDVGRAMIKVAEVSVARANEVLMPFQMKTREEIPNERYPNLGNADPARYKELLAAAQAALTPAAQAATV